VSKTYNKGEWSELYTFLYTLGHGEIYAANEEMVKESDVKYNVISAFQKDTEYIIDKEKNEIIHDYNNKQYSHSIDEIKETSEVIFQEIKRGKGRTFTIPEADKVIDSLHINSLKAGSNLKGDINITVHDVYTNTKHILSFSVKSYIGGRATLLNSSKQTTFVYELTKPLTSQEIKEVNAVATSNKIRDKIMKIGNLGSSLRFYDCPSPVFVKNLKMIDYNLPSILAELYLASYFVKGKRIKEVISYYIQQNPNEDVDLINYKVNQLLVAVALGMVPDTTWNGIDEATGGYMVVKEDGEILCYHLYERNKLSRYLFTHTSFDTPSSSRYGIGDIYIDPLTRKQFLNLNIQIRFCH